MDICTIGVIVVAVTVIAVAGFGWWFFMFPDLRGDGDV